MRTDAEILAHIEAVEENDFFGTMKAGLMAYLPFETVKPFLKDSATPESWGDARPRDAEAVKAELVDYMPFAWEKANDCRGLSAGRSINHMQVWLWMLGYGKAADRIEKYTLYGKPQLAAICETFGIDWRALDNGRWTYSELMDGTRAPETVAALEPDQ